MNLHKKHKKCYIGIGVLILLCIIGAVGLGSLRGNDAERICFPENQDGKVNYLKFASDIVYYENDINANAGAIASLTPYREGSMLAAGYAALFYMDFSTSDYIQAIPCPEGYHEIYDGQKDGNLWNPTGVYCDPEQDLLYIANYNGGDVLVCRIDENREVQVINKITDVDMVSPENVYVKNSKVAVADYDGNKLFLFNEDGSLEWKRDIGLAHGVTMSDDKVYVTSLLERKVYSYDYEGNLLKEAGQLGYEGTDSYMWPTALEYYEESGQVLVTDAHTGRIYCLDGELQYESSIGGNGPSNNAFNFPYCAIISNENIYVSDVFNHRVMVLDFSGEIQSIYGRRLDGTPDNLLLHPYNNIPYSYGELAGADSTLFNPFFKSKVISGYSSLFFEDEQGNIRQINYSDYLQNGDFFEWETPKLQQPYCLYVCNYNLNNKEYSIMLSPQLGWQYFIYDVTDNIAFIYETTKSNEEGFPIWCINNQWYSEGDIDSQLQKAISSGEEYIEEFVYETENGMDRRTAYTKCFAEYYNKVFGIDLTEEQFYQWLAGCYTTKAGKDFWNSYDPGGENSKLADVYFKETFEQKSEMYLCEALFVRMLGLD